MLTAESIALSLPKCRRISANHFLACCPAHNDSSPSLQIKQEGDKVLFHCFAGCSQNEVLDTFKAMDLWFSHFENYQPKAHFSNEELLELFFLVDIYDNSRNRPDLPLPSKSDAKRACNARKVLKAYNYGVKEAIATIVRMGERNYVR